MGAPPAVASCPSSEWRAPLTSARYLLKPFRGKGNEDSEATAEEAVDPRQEQIAAIERELVLGTPSPGHWQELSRLQFADDQVDGVTASITKRPTRFRSRASC